jgi:DNA polymerase III subunit beta
VELTVDQAGLARALRLIGRVLPSRTPLPILQTVLLTAEPGRLVVRGSSVEVALATALAADVKAAGQVAVSAHALSDWVSELAPEPLALRHDNARSRLHARCGRFSGQFATSPAEDFPALPTADLSTALDLEGPPLRAAIARVVFAAAPDEKRPVLAGVRVALTAEGVMLAACDGFRLAVAHVPAGCAAAEQLLVPARAMNEATHLLESVESARLLLAPDRRALHLVAGSSTLTAILLDGTYPEVDRLVPTGWRTRVTASRLELDRAVHAARLFGTAGHGHPVVLEVKRNDLQVRARGDERGDAAGAVGATIEGDPQTITLNARLLADVLEAARTPQVELSWEHRHAPVVLREAGARPRGSPPLHPSDLWLIMPLKDPSASVAPAAAAA